MSLYQTLVLDETLSLFHFCHQGTSHHFISLRVSSSSLSVFAHFFEGLGSRCAALPRFGAGLDLLEGGSTGHSSGDALRWLVVFWRGEFVPGDLAILSCAVAEQRKLH